MKITCVSVNSQNVSSFTPDMASSIAIKHFFATVNFKKLLTATVDFRCISFDTLHNMTLQSIPIYVQIVLFKIMMQTLASPFTTSYKCFTDQTLSSLQVKILLEKMTLATK